MGAIVEELTALSDDDAALVRRRLRGRFRDAYHPDERREIALSSADGSEAASIRVSGAGADGTAFDCPGTFDPRSGEVVVDFTAKGGPAALRGQAVGAVPLSRERRSGIMWEDGNTWEKLST